MAPVGSRVGPFVPPPDVSNKKQDEQYMALGGALGEGANGYANQFTVGTIAGTAIGAVGGIVGSIIGAVVGAAVSAVSIGIGWVVSKIKTWFENRRRRKAAEQAYREAVDRDRHAQEKDIAETLAFMKQHPVNGQLLTTHARQTCEATSIFDQTIKLEIDLTQAEIVKWGNLYQDNLAKLAEDRRKLEEWQLAVKNYGERVIQTVLNAIEQQAMQAKERRNRILRFMALFAKNIVPYEQKISSCLSPLFSYEERELCMSEMMDRANLEIEELEKQVLEAEQHDEPHIVRTKNSFFIFVANCQERLQESGTWIE